MKKILALVIATLLLAASLTVAMADVALTVSNPVAGHAYKYFQLFTGDLANGKLSNVKWGADAKTSALTYYKKANADATTFTVAATVTPVVGADVPQEVLDYLASLPSGSTVANPAQETANFISNWVTGEGHAITSTTQVPTGYYVITDSYTDADGDGKENTTLSTNIVAVVNSTTITPKAGTTTHEKEVLDINDTQNVALDLSNLKNLDTDAYDWDDSADYDFGDHVPFKLTTTVAADFASYDSYFLKVYDSMGTGLTLDQDSIVVYVDGTLATRSTATDAEAIAADKAAGKYILRTTNRTFDVQFDKLNGISGVDAGSKVVVYYTATLTNEEGVVIGNPGNVNESWVEFSNNPNDDQDGTATTPKETAVVFTYQTIVNKTDGTNALVGAEFELKKLLQSGSYSDPIAVVKFTSAGIVTTKVADGTTTSQGDATKFSFNGLDDGTYVLHESVTPAGYNTIDDVTFRIEASHTASGTTLNVVNADGSAFSGDLTFSKVSNEAGYSTDVVNREGSTLPSTGGIGTTLFYVGGGILVLAAIILLVTKKRMSAND